MTITSGVTAQYSTRALGAFREAIGAAFASGNGALDVEKQAALFVSRKTA